MSLTSRVAALWRNLVHGEQVGRDLDEEVRAALEILIEEKVGAGMGQEDARRAATMELGGVEPVKGRVRDVRAGATVDALLQDIRYAVRTLRRAPVFVLTAALSLGMGIGGNATIFSLAEASFFRDMPAISNPDRLVEVGRSFRTKPFGNMSYPNYVDYRDRNTVFDGLAAYFLTSEAFGLGFADTADRVDGIRVSGNYFSVLGIGMALGRGLMPDDERANAEPVVVLTDRLWRTRFTADIGVIGRTIRLNGRPVAVVGVAAPGFSGHTVAVTDLWVPLTFESGGVVHARDAQWLLAIGRLKPGVSIEQARAEMTGIARDLEREYPDVNEGNGIALAPWRPRAQRARRPRGWVYGDPLCVGWADPAHRLHERRRDLAGARRHPRPGNRSASGARRPSRACGTAARH